MSSTADNTPGDPAEHARYPAPSVGSEGFIARHDLWDEEQREAAVELDSTLDSLDFVRLVVADPHGLARSKTLTAHAFRTVLANGIGFSPAPFVLDTGHALAVDLFAASGAVGIPELSGAGGFMVVPDPLTFRILPHTSRPTGWVIGDEYLRSGAPHPLSSRRVLRGVSADLRVRDLECVVGLEVEWYLTRCVNQGCAEGVGGFGIQGEPPVVVPVDAGYQLNLEGLTDALAPVLDPLADAVIELGLPLRTIEHESGPGQLEFTFDPLEALVAADAMLLFRTVTKQVCARLGHHASFMALPGLPRFNPSGWHLHQSLVRGSSGQNLFASDRGDLLSPLGRGFLGGLLEHAVPGALLCTPTINGYRRLDGQFGFSPDRVVWCTENRGALLRVLGGFADPATHIENRIGEPCANPYLYLASQVTAGLDGVERCLDPGKASANPHQGTATALPRNLREALDAFAGSTHYRQVLGAPLMECLSKLKLSELARYEEWQARSGPVPAGGASEWEHREYFASY